MKRARPTPNRKVTSLLLRGLDPELVDIFKERARRSGRSLQSELQLSLRREAHRNFDEALRVADQWHGTLRGRTFKQTTTMIAEDRRR